MDQWFRLNRTPSLRLNEISRSETLARESKRTRTKRFALVQWSTLVLFIPPPLTHCRIVSVYALQPRVIFWLNWCVLTQQNACLYWEFNKVSCLPAYQYSLGVIDDMHWLIVVYLIVQRPCPLGNLKQWNMVCSSYFVFLYLKLYWSVDLARNGRSDLYLCLHSMPCQELLWNCRFVRLLTL